jgi:hypothetical protein
MDGLVIAAILLIVLFVGRIVFKVDTRMFILACIVLLSASGLLALAGDQTNANAIVIAAFYCLAFGVLLQLIEYMICVHNGAVDKGGDPKPFLGRLDAVSQKAWLHLRELDVPARLLRRK